MLVICDLLILMLMLMELLLEVTCENIAVVVLLLIDSTEVLTSIILQGVVDSTGVDVLITRDLCTVVVIDVVDDRCRSSRSFMDMMMVVMNLDRVAQWVSTTSSCRRRRS